MDRTSIALLVSLSTAVPSVADAQSLDPAVKAASELPRLHSLLVSRRGELILERYFNGRRASTPANIKSVAKSVISALIGIAHDRKLLDLKHPIGRYFSDVLAAAADAPKRAITIEDLLTMRSGLETTSSRNYGAWVQSRNWVRHALAKRLVVPPASDMIYSTGNSHLLSAILTKATGRSTWQFAQETLAKPLGFRLAPWPRDPQGIYFGGNDMLMTPRQMLAFGELYLNNGKVRLKPDTTYSTAPTVRLKPDTTYSTNQVVSASYVEQSFVPRGRSRISGREYGYGWWTREMAGRRAYYAWGFGGQYIFLIPSLDLVVVSTSSATVGEDRRSHRRTVDEIIEQLIVAPLGDAN